MTVELDVLFFDKLAGLLANDPALDACLATIFAERRRAFRDWAKDNIDNDALNARIADLVNKQAGVFFDSLYKARGQLRRPDTIS